MSFASYGHNLANKIKRSNSLNVIDITIPPYTPVNEKARQFHLSTAKINILPGGNQSGKTTTAAHDHVMFARICPPGCQGLALTNTYKDIGKNLWPHYKECMHPSEWEWIAGNEKSDNPTIIKLKSNGYKFHFGSYEQGRLAHQGSIWNYFHPDEECPQPIFEEVYRGTIAKGARIGYSYTPLEGYEYLDDFIEKAHDPTNRDYWAPAEPMTLLENPYISEEEKRIWMDMLSEQSIQTRIYGYACSNEGLIYREYQDVIHVCEPFPVPDDWRFYRGIDFGYEHPTTSIIMASDGYKLYIISEYYQSHRLVADHVIAMKEQLQSLATVSGNPPRIISISDHDKQLRMEYEKQGIHTKAAKKDVLPGIETVRNLLKVRSDKSTRLQVFSTCKYTRKEFKRYKRQPVDKMGNLKEGEKGEMPVKQDDHCLDPIRYCAVEQFGFFDEQRHKIIIVR